MSFILIVPVLIVVIISGIVVFIVIRKADTAILNIVCIIRVVVVV